MQRRLLMWFQQRALVPVRPRATSLWILALVSFTLLHLAPGTAWSQDSHYWTEQYGNRARLLGGAFIGGGSDISVVYYNPGALALMETPEILLAGNVFQVQNVAVQPPIPESEKTNRYTMDMTPSLFAGQLKNKVAGGRLAFSMLTRTRSDFRLEGQTSVLGGDFVIPDTSFAANNTLLENKVGDFWMGATWSRRLGARAGFGISTYFANRTQTARIQNTVTLLGKDQRAAVSSQVRDFTFFNLRLLWKMGLAINLEKWQLGFTVTTPGLPLVGNGTSTVDASAVAPDDPAGNPKTFVAVDRQKVSSEFRSPLSVGVGASRAFGATGIYLAVEWFQRIDTYTILDTEPFQSQSSGETLSSDVTHRLKSVTNFSIGVEHRLSRGRRLYGSVWTDFNAREEESVASTTPFDLYHFGGGYSFAVDRSDITLGGVFAFGSSDTKIGGGLDLVVRDSVSASFVRATFIVGFSFVFAEG